MTSSSSPPSAHSATARGTPSCRRQPARPRTRGCLEPLPHAAATSSTLASASTFDPLEEGSGSGSTSPNPAGGGGGGGGGCISGSSLGGGFGSFPSPLGSG